MSTSPKVTTIVKRLNPYALRLSSRLPPWATLHHVGRSSGRAYATPVVALAARGASGEVVVLTPLPWGADVDWCRNVRAAGTYALTRKGTRYDVDEPRVVGAAEARRLLGRSGRFMGRVPRIDAFVLGRLLPAAAGPRAAG